jgi:nicotinic acid phosphoribosyltransferase
MNSLLLTDGYKFSMAEAGWPLRTETFYYTHRSGGPQILPLDVAKFVKGLLPDPEDATGYHYLDINEYEMGIGFKSAMKLVDKLVVRSLAPGSIFYPKEPSFSITGPSALVSWLEPLTLQINYRVQVATLARRTPEAIHEVLDKVTCQRQKEIVLETLDAVGVKAPKIEVCPEEYHARVLAQAKSIIQVVKDPRRVFEVGLRSATCPEQHEIAVRACAEAGITKTSNVLMASVLGIAPVGTMGHEHVQRFASDEEAFRAMRDRRPHRSSYLLDTYDAFLSGIPAALRVMAENPEGRDSMRYDSKNKLSEMMFANAGALDLGLRPIHLVEDGLDLPETQKFEKARETLAIPQDDMFFGYGGFFVAKPAFGSLTRDRVQAVWKLCQTGPMPTMKWAPGKESIPGEPVVFRRRSVDGPIGLIGQVGEEVPHGYSLETGMGEPYPANPGNSIVGLSPATQALRDQCAHRYNSLRRGL